MKRKDKNKNKAPGCLGCHVVSASDDCFGFRCRMNVWYQPDKAGRQKCYHPSGTILAISEQDEHIAEH